jgi:hypothetical protein
MKKLVFTISIALSSLAYAEANVDFSKAYVVPSKSGVDKVTIGGLKPSSSDLFYSVDFTLTSDYNLNISGVMNQSSIQEQLEQSLRNTTWVGKYLINENNYSTTLKLVVVQDGYVGGEIIHSPEADDGDYLHTRVTGDILTQYKIDDTFIDEDSLTNTILDNLSPETATRQLIRIKRVRALKFEGSNWGTNREYRMRLENGILSGSVGTPNDKYGSGDATKENGNIMLTLQK